MESKSARKELLRFLRLGKSVRSRNGANHVRNFILEIHAEPVIHRLCHTYHIRVADLCLACAEILDAKPDPAGAGASENPSSLLLFSDPLRLEGFLKKLRAATHGHALIQHRLAIISCARAHADEMDTPVPDQRPPTSRSNLLKKSIFNNLMLMALIAGLVIAGILITVFLL